MYYSHMIRLLIFLQIFRFPAKSVTVFILCYNIHHTGHISEYLHLFKAAVNHFWLILVPIDKQASLKFLNFVAVEKST